MIILTIFLLSVLLVCYSNKRNIVINFATTRYQTYPAVLSMFFVIYAALIPRFLSESTRGEMFFSIVMISVLTMAAKIDFFERIIPNDLVVLLMVVSVMFLFLKLLVYSDDFLVTASSAILGFAFGSGVLLLANLFQKNGVGAGDIKLFGVLGFALGISGVIVVYAGTFFFAAAGGILLMVMKKIKRRDVIPLAPFVFLAMCIYS